MKRLMTFGLVLAVALMAVAPIAAPAQAAVAGDLIKMSGNPAVYFLGSDMKRYVFPNYNTYATWYKDFSGVVTVSQSELESYSLGGNVTYRPGTRLVKITTNPKVYAVEPGGTLRWVNSESIMSSLYGAEWWNRIDDVNDAFWVNYTEGADITSAIYPTGSLVKETGDSTIYYIDGGEKRPVADMTAFDANRFNMANVMTAASLAGYTAGTSITGNESAISSIDGSTSNGGSASTGTLTVSLAGDTPVSTTIVKSATRVPFTKVNFTASGGDVIVDSVQIKRLGLSQDSNFSEVYLIDSATNALYGNEKTLSSTHTAYVTKDFTVTSGTTKSFYLGATMASSLQAAEVASLAVSEVNVKGNAVVAGSFPINGNEMTMNTSIAIGTITQTAGSSNPSAASKQVGLTDYVFAAAKLAANSTEDVQIEGIKFHQAGTAADSDIGNFDLVLEGTVLATVATADDGDVYFDLSSAPYTIGKGLNKTFEIRGDILDGSGRTIWFNFDKKTDVIAKGKTYGYYINPSYQNTATPYMDNSSSDNNAVTTISTGTLVVSKKQLDNTYVAEGATQATIGAFNFRANGEPIIITALDVEITTTTLTNSGLTDNVTLYDENGDVVAGPVTPSEIDSPVSDVAVARFSDTFTVPTGEHVYYVKADLDSNFTAGDTIVCSIANPATSASSADEITAKGEVTNNTVYPTPYTEVTADQMTIRVGALTFNTLNTPVAQTVVAGTDDHIFSYFVLDAASSGEDIKVTQLSIHHTSTTGAELGNISGLTLLNGSTVLNNNDIEDGDSSATGSYATTTIDLDNPLIIPKGSSVTLTLKGDISASADEGHKFGLFGDDVLVAYGNSTGNSITETGTASQGQTQTATSNAALTVAVSSASASSDGLIPGNTDGVEVGVFNFRAQYADIDLEELYLTIDELADGSGLGGPDQFDKIYLYDGATKVAEATATTTDSDVESAAHTIHFDMSSSPVTITGGTSKDLTVKVDTSNPDYYNYGTDTKAESGEGFFLKINAVGDIIARSNGLLAAGSKTLNSATLKSYTLFRSIPTILTNDKLADGVSGDLSSGTESSKEVYKFSVTADPAGDVALYKVSFWISTTTATMTEWTLWEGGTQVAASSTPIVVDDSANTTRTQIIEFLFTSTGDAPVATEKDVVPETIPAGTTKTYTMKATLEGPSGTNTGSIKIQFLGDGTVTDTNVPDSAVDLRTGADGLYENNLIWGDLWRTFDTASGNASTTEQWANGYLIPTGATTKLGATSTSVTWSK